MDVSMSDSDSDEFAMNAMKELEKHIMEHEFHNFFCEGH